MFLKSLTIKGFKSFAEPATLTLEPGVTVVVGPNGSGKSNVVDAISWVLGAQAPTAVRSQKMDDVIFAGTLKRPALGRAEVSLTIDNSSAMLPIEFNEVTISRTLFRTGDSEYQINGVPCRLLDIQELLSDSGVGRQQHVVISQGQIDAVLNARPEDRRQIIEEAAGVLKFRKRKEKAERRLNATEANLNRVQDLLREVRRQLRPLEKQADAARRHGDLVAELRALQVFQAGRELTTLREQVRAGVQTRQDLQLQQRELKSTLAALDTEILAAEAKIAARGDDDLGDELVRYESLRERAKGLSALLQERLRGIERERGSFTAQDVVANLESEAERCRTELVTVQAETSELQPEADRLTASEAALASDRDRFQELWADGVPAPSGAAAELRGELGALRASVERSESEMGRLVARIASVDEKLVDLDAQRTRRRSDIQLAEDAESPLVASLDAAEAALDAAREQLTDAEEARRGADSEVNSWAARVDALTLALDEARSKAGAERLADIEGVLGTLLDLVEIDPGWEAAFQAAAGEALTAVVVDSVDTARTALASLRSGEVGGAVLALGSATEKREAPTIGVPVRDHVRSDFAGVDELLDMLVGHAVAVDGDVLEAVDVAHSFAGSLVVTTKGDRVGPTGWRVGVAQAEATGAARNEAVREGELARERFLLADEQLRTVRAEVTRLETEQRELSRSLDANDAMHSAAADALQRVESEARDLDTERDGLRGRVDELEERIARDAERVVSLEAELPAHEAAEAETAEAAKAMADARSSLEERSAAVGALRTDIEVRAAALEQRRELLQGRLAQIDEQLERDAGERAAAATRREALDAQQSGTEFLMRALTSRVAVVDEHLTELRERRRQQGEEARALGTALDELRRKRQGSERELETIRERLSRSEIEDAELRVRLDAAVEAIRHDLDTDPESAMAAECPPLDEGVTAAGRTRDLERELKLMGPINPLALQEFEALQERHDFLQEQLDDIRGSRKELRKVIRSIDEEIVTVFASAYADVATNFETLFSSLFPGGKGALKLTDNEQLLETGIEIEAKPGGKNVRKLSLLSGGERSLTALAFLFAVFRSRPSPFYVMDEVEAALDDLNLHRFLALVAEFRDDAQLLIVSHQKRTMEAADCLYGVSMQPGGSSKVVSEKVGAA